jgi:hypothetical protein
VQIRDYRSEWKIEVHQPIAGNYYPVIFRLLPSLCFLMKFNNINKMVYFLSESTSKNSQVKSGNFHSVDIILNCLFFVTFHIEFYWLF